MAWCMQNHDRLLAVYGSGGLRHLDGYRSTEVVSRSRKIFLHDSSKHIVKDGFCKSGTRRRSKNDLNIWSISIVHLEMHMIIVFTYPMKCCTAERRRRQTRLPNSAITGSKISVVCALASLRQSQYQPGTPQHPHICPEDTA